jgi:hypothetical protein
MDELGTGTIELTNLLILIQPMAHFLNFFEKKFKSHRLATLAAAPFLVPRFCRHKFDSFLFSKRIEWNTAQEHHSSTFEQETRLSLLCLIYKQISKLNQRPLL